MNTDRFNSDEPIDMLISNEFIEGEDARTHGKSLTCNPYNITEKRKRKDWTTGWCDRDMTLSGEIDYET